MRCGECSSLGMANDQVRLCLELALQVMTQNNSFCIYSNYYYDNAL